MKAALIQFAQRVYVETAPRTHCVAMMSVGCVGPSKVCFFVFFLKKTVLLHILYQFLIFKTVLFVFNIIGS